MFVMSENALLKRQRPTSDVGGEVTRNTTVVVVR